jgi:glycosyltransferase involved in cell wall biosynthesis
VAASHPEIACTVVNLPHAVKRRAVVLIGVLLPWLLRVLRVTQPPLARLRGAWRRRNGHLRSVWGVTPILTLPLLARADRLLGLQSESMVYVTYYITRSFDRRLSRSHDWILRHHPTLYRTYCELVFLLALPRYDIFHYFYDRGLMAPQQRYGIHPDELHYLQSTGRQLYTYAYGADVRERSATLALGDWNFCRECADPGMHCVCNSDELAASMRQLPQVARAMHAMGDMLTYVPNPSHLHYWPIDMARIPAAEPARLWRVGMPLVVAHAPNHGHFKGTKYVLQAVEQLRGEGVPIELKLVQGVPNTEVLELFWQADVVLDQLVGGFYGYTALEAMALGKPVISYVRTSELALPGCPIINATPDTIVQVLRDLCAGSYDLEALAQQGAAYARDHNSIEAVARRLAQVYLRTADLPASVRARIESAQVALSPVDTASQAVAMTQTTTL